MALREFAEKGFLGLAPFGLSKLFGGDDEESNLAGFKLPDYFEDPTFQKTHKFMGDFGMDILGGNIPDYYKAIGESGGKEFEDMLNLQKRDITQGITETAALTGRGRGGGVSAQVGEAVGEASTKARYADFLRSLGGKQFFFQQGRGITEGARGAGQNQENARNTFGMNRSGLDLDFRGQLDQQESEIGSA
nr:hypothetical protein [Bacteroidota bacterium]